MAGGLEELPQFGGVILIRTVKVLRVRQSDGIRPVVEARNALAVFDGHARTGDKAFQQFIAFGFSHDGRGLFFRGKVFNLGRIEDREGIQQGMTPHIGNALCLLFGNKVPLSVIFHREEHVLRAQHGDAVLSFSDADVQVGMFLPDRLKLFEGEPAIVGVALFHSGQRQTHHVRAAVFLSGHGAKGRFAHGRLTLFSVFGQRQHGLGNAVDELFLHFTADLKTAFSFLLWRLAHCCSSLMSTITASCSSCGLMNPAVTASSRLMRNAPASSCRSMSAWVSATRSFSEERRAASNRPKLFRFSVSICFSMFRYYQRQRLRHWFSVFRVSRRRPMQATRMARKQATGVIPVR